RLLRRAIRELLEHLKLSESLMGEIERLLAEAVEEHRTRALEAKNHRKSTRKQSTWRRRFHQRIEAYERSRELDPHELTLASRLNCLEKLEKSRAGRNKAVETASHVEYQDLTPREKRDARHRAEQLQKALPPLPRSGEIGKRELVCAFSRALCNSTGAKRH